MIVSPGVFSCVVCSVVIPMCLEVPVTVVAVGSEVAVPVVWLELHALSGLHTVVVHTNGVVAILVVSPNLEVMIGHPYMGDSMRNEVHPWQLIDL